MKNKKDTLMNDVSTLFPNDDPHTMEEALKPGVCTSLIVDEFYFDGFHGGHGEDGLHNTRAQST